MTRTVYVDDPSTPEAVLAEMDNPLYGYVAEVSAVQWRGAGYAM